MWKRLVTGLGAAAALMLAVGCTSPASPVGASSSAPAPRSGVSTAASAVSTSAGPGGLPQLQLRPASGPVGTYVTISGQLNPDQVRATEPEFQRPAYFNLITMSLSAARKTRATARPGQRALRAVN